MRAGILLLVVGAALAAPAAPARAEPNDLVGRPLVLAPGELDASLTVETSLRARRIHRPLSLAPDAWVGVTRRLTIGIVHSNRSVDQIDPRATFCLRDDGLSCDRAYRGSGVDVRYLVRPWLAPRARVLLRDVDPAKPAVALGALARWRRGRFAITTDPYLRLGVANRDKGNRAALVLPVWFAVQPTCRWVVALHTGYTSDVAVLRDGWHAPVGLIAGVRAYGGVELAAEFGFPSLLGPQNEFSDRVLIVTAGWRGQVIRPAPRRGDHEAAAVSGACSRVARNRS